MPEDESPVVLPRLASRKLIALTLMVALVALLYWQFHDYLRIDWFAERETADNIFRYYVVARDFSSEVCESVIGFGYANYYATKN